jgi:hypothetical protein
MEMTGSGVSFVGGAGDIVRIGERGIMWTWRTEQVDVSHGTSGLISRAEAWLGTSSVGVVCGNNTPTA